jgi:hypothetical protein
LIALEEAAGIGRVCAPGVGGEVTFQLELLVVSESSVHLVRGMLLLQLRLRHLLVDGRGYVDDGVVGGLGDELVDGVVWRRQLVLPGAGHFNIPAACRLLILGSGSALGAATTCRPALCPHWASRCDRMARLSTWPSTSGSAKADLTCLCLPAMCWVSTGAAWPSA